MNRLASLKNRLLLLQECRLAQTVRYLSRNAQSRSQGQIGALDWPASQVSGRWSIASKAVSPLLFLTLILFLFSACQNNGKSDETSGTDGTKVDTLLQDTLGEGTTSLPVESGDISGTTQSSPKGNSLVEKSPSTAFTEEKPTSLPTGAKSADSTEEQSADDEVQTEDIEILDELRAISVAERQEMINVKKAAEQLGGQSKTLFTEALDKEQEADQQFQQNTQIGFINSQRLYKTAKGTYSDIVDQLKQAEENLAGQQAAEKLRAEVNRVRQALPGTAAQLKANVAYQNAQEREAIAEQYFKQGNYEQASTSFQRAKDLYANVRISKPTVPPPAPPPAEEKSDNALAIRKIKGMLDTYANGLETADLNGLRAGGFISRQEEVGWAQFFRNVQDVTVKVQNEKLNINGNNATVNFNILMSFFNKSKRKREDSQYPKTWKMKNSNGNWQITGFK